MFQGNIQSLRIRPHEESSNDNRQDCRNQYCSDPVNIFSLKYHVTEFNALNITICFLVSILVVPHSDYLTIFARCIVSATCYYGIHPMKVR